MPIYLNNYIFCLDLNNKSISPTNQSYLMKVTWIYEWGNYSSCSWTCFGGQFCLRWDELVKPIVLAWHKNVTCLWVLTTNYMGTYMRNSYVYWYFSFQLLISIRSPFSLLYSNHCSFQRQTQSHHHTVAPIFFSHLYVIKYLSLYAGNPSKHIYLRFFMVF